MDFYLQTGMLLLMMIGLSFFIYVFMTPAQLFNNMFGEATATLQARIEGTVNIDIQLFNNNTSVPGTMVMPLLRDAGANGLALMVQTRAQRGMVVNYGVQLRGPAATQVRMPHSANTGVGAISGFETNFVTPVNILFGEADNWDAAGPTNSTMGSEALFAASALTLYNGTAIRGTDNLGIDTDTFTPTDHPMLTFWDTFMEDYAAATRAGRTYSSTGFLFTPQIRRTNMPVNENTSLAANQGTPFFINQSSQFHTTFIVDQTGTVVGIYIEEHNTAPEGAILAAAMVAEGYINHTLQFGTTTTTSTED